MEVMSLEEGRGMSLAESWAALSLAPLAPPIIFWSWAAEVACFWQTQQWNFWTEILSFFSRGKRQQEV